MLSSPSARSLTAVLNGNKLLQCPTAEYPCSAQAPNHQVFLPPSIPAVLNRRVSPISQETLHFLSNNGFSVGMLEANNFGCYWDYKAQKLKKCILKVGTEYGARFGDQLP